MIWRWLTSWLRLPAQDAGSRQRQAQVTRFRAEINDAGVRGDAALLSALAARPAELGLADEDVEMELELRAAWLDVLELAGSARLGDLPVLETNHRVVGADTCYFIAPAFAVDRPHEPGKVFLTDRRVMFVGSTVTSAGWGRVSRIDDVERDLVVVWAGASGLRRYRFNTLRDAKRGAFVARWLKDRLARQRVDPGGVINA